MRVTHIVAFCVLVMQIFGKEFRIGLIGPEGYQTSIGLDGAASAVTIAVDTLKAEGVLSNHSFR